MTEAFDSTKLDQYSVEELQEYISILETSKIIKKHIRIRRVYIVCVFCNLILPLIGMVPLAIFLNLNSFVGVLSSFLAILTGQIVLESLICRVLIFLADHFEVEIID